MFDRKESDTLLLINVNVNHTNDRFRIFDGVIKFSTGFEDKQIELFLHVSHRLFNFIANRYFNYGRRSIHFDTT
jgi:hypothetical protein